VNIQQTTMQQSDLPSSRMQLLFYQIPQPINRAEQ